MKKIILLFFILLLLPITAFAVINPYYKECMQRGYPIENEHCVMPDGTRCLIAGFNEGTCGSEYKTDEYCIEQGMKAWDRDKCCPGLDSYLPAGVAGQPTCEPALLGNSTPPAGDATTAPGFIAGAILLAFFMLYHKLKK